MKKAASAFVVCSLAIVFLSMGCLRKKKEKEQKPGQPPGPSPPEQEQITITPEQKQKVQDLLAPASQRELTELEREELLGEFAQLGKPAVMCLIDELKKEDIEARDVIIGILGRLGDPSAVDVLVEQLKERREGDRQAAVKALGEIADLKAIPALISTLQGDKRKRVRAEAASALGILRAKEAVIPLIQGLDPTRERKRWVRRNAAEALGLIGDLQGKEPLMQALNDKESVVRVAAMFGLYKLGNTASLTLLERRATDGDAEEEVRQWAVRELGLIGSGQSVSVLAEAMNDASPVVRLTAAESIGRIPGVEPLDVLIGGLQDQDSAVRNTVVDALVRRGAPPVGEGGQRLFDALAEVVKNEPVETIRKKAKALYDLIKPTLPPPAPTPSPDTSAPSPESDEASAPDSGKTTTETPSGAEE
jgi:HEAT repeat protein